MASILPPDWQDLLGRVSTWLEAASVQADARELAFRARLGEDMMVRPDLRTPIDERLRQIASFMPAASEDDCEITESSLRGLIARSESLRLALAEGVGRAIG